MPDSWANALRPTIALFGCTGYPVRRETSREVRAISFVLATVCSPTSSRRVCSSMTISSSDAFPARSPMPLTAHSTCRARLPLDVLSGRLELVADVNVRGRDERVDSWSRGVPDGAPGRIDVGHVRAREPSDDRTLHGPRDRLHSFEVAGRGDGESRLDD